MDKNGVGSYPNSIPNGQQTSGSSNMLGGIGSLLNGASSLANAYIGYKNYGLAKDMFGFEKSATNRNIENQGKIANNAYDNAGAVGLALGGGAMSPEEIAAANAAIKAKHVNTTPIG